MHSPRTRALCLGLTFVVALSACSKNSTGDEDSATTAAESPAEPVGALPTPTTTTPDPAVFDRNLAAARAELAEPSQDFCTTVAQSLSVSSVGQASTPEQVEALYALYRDSLIKLATSVPNQSESDVEVLTLAANQIYAEAEAGGFDPTIFTLEQTPEAMNDDAIVAAMSRLSEAIGTTCAPVGG